MGKGILVLLGLFFCITNVVAGIQSPLYTSIAFGHRNEDAVKAVCAGASLEELTAALAFAAQAKDCWACALFQECIDKMKSEQKSIDEPLSPVVAQEMEPEAKKLPVVNHHLAPAICKRPETSIGSLNNTEKALFVGSLLVASSFIQFIYSFDKLKRIEQFLFKFPWIDWHNDTSFYKLSLDEAISMLVPAIVGHYNGRRYFGNEQKVYPAFLKDIARAMRNIDQYLRRINRIKSWGLEPLYGINPEMVQRAYGGRRHLAFLREMFIEWMVNRSVENSFTVMAV